MSADNFMTTSVSGMDAQAQYLASISSNIANSTTVGYKSESMNFSTLVDLASGAPEGVSVAPRFAIKQQGTLETTASPTDLAIQGNGFFVVSDPSGATALTRAGSFVADSSGNLLNAAGLQLMGFNISNPNQLPAASGPTSLVPINISTSGLQATPSTTGSLAMNLPSTNAVSAGPFPSTNAANASFDAQTSLVAYDNKGGQITLDIYGTKTAADTWEVSVFNRADAAAAGGFPYASGPLATTTLAFNSTNGSLTSASPHSLSVPVPNGQSLSLDLSSSTELASPFAVEGSNVNGNAPSSFDHISVSKTGVIDEVYQNGAQIQRYQLAMGTVPSPDNLSQISGDAFALSSTSGSLNIGTAGSSGFGSIASNALEQSTVDITAELTNMIEAQRNYSANSKVFQTGTNIIDTVIGLVR